MGVSLTADSRLEGFTFPQGASRLLQEVTYMKVCILNEQDAQMFLHAGMEYKCSSRRHHHSSKTKVDEMVRAGEMVWLGKHCKVATFKNPRTWKKTYVKNLYGETLSCGMQLVR